MAQHFNLQKNKGYTALFAVLVSSLILSVGIGIINITLKEIALSASGRESQFAFYAADSATECAQYWDNKEAFVIPTTTPIIPTINCFGGGVSNVAIEDDRTEEYATTTFSFTMPGTTFCGDVEVGKYLNDTTGPKTVIVAYGRNICGAASSRQVERGLIIDY